MTSPSLRVPACASRAPIALGGALLALGHGGAWAAELPPIPDAPVRIPVEMAYDGTLAVSVTDAAGKLVRRVCSEERRSTGALKQPWDLLDDAGNLVPAGTYRWTAITVPSIKLTYEGTVNNAGHPPWPSPKDGGGQWMADHSPPASACAVGDLMFLGSGCAESGHAAIAVDRDGRKRWGMGAVGAAWMGADRIATDGKYAYLANVVGVFRVDPKDFAFTDVIRFAYSPDLPPPAAGGFGDYRNDIAIRGDRLLVAIDGASVHLRGSAASAAIDYEACQPPLPSQDGDTDGNYSSAQRWQASLGLPDAPPSSRGQTAIGPVLTDGPLAGTCTVVFKQSVPIASILLSDASAEAWVLRADADPKDAGIGARSPSVAMDDAQADTDPLNEDLWQPLHQRAKGGSDAVLASTTTPVHTRALRFKSGAPLAFAVPFDRRYADISAAATVASSDGKAAPGGAWQVSRDPKTATIDPASPAAMVMVWPTAQHLRGLALIDPNEAYFAVDVWTGTGAPNPATCAAERTWREVGGVRGEVFGPRPKRATFRLIDFGSDETVAAVRVRAVRPAGYRTYMGGEAPVQGAHTATIGRIVAIQPIGGDLADLPPDLSQRISEYRILPAGGTELVRHVPVPHPGRLAFAPDGTLFAESNDALVTVDPTTGATKTVIPAKDLNGPAGMVFDRDGNLVLAQRGIPAVGVFTPAGKPLRGIGKPGPRPVGPFDPLTFCNPVTLAKDSAGGIWVVEGNFTPKRVTRWSPDGAQLEKQFFGPTQYGGGGWLDPRDPTLLYYNGMKFRFDYATRDSKLESMVFIGGQEPCLRTSPPDRPAYVGDRRYLLADSGATLGIYAEKDGKAIPLVAAGNLAMWGDADALPELRSAFAGVNRATSGFVWSDRNGDRKPQKEEVQIVPGNPLHLVSSPELERIGDDLSLHFRDCRLRPTGFSADGVPLYDAAKLEVSPLIGNTWATADGSALMLSNSPEYTGVRMIEPDGKTVRWSYVDNYAGVHGSHRIGYDRPAGTLVGTDHIIGHFPVGTAGEHLWVVAGNHGDWFTFTNDGILAACLSGGPLNFGKRFWTFPEYEPGKTDISNLCVGEEHFAGSVIRAADGRVLMVAGHNHNSIVRVDGLDQLKRSTGTLTVTADDLKKTTDFLLQRQIAERARLGPRVMTMPLSEHSAIVVDGKSNDWNSSNFVTIEDRWDEPTKRTVIVSSGGLAADAENLYIAGMTTDESPLLNAAADPTLAFKHGDAFDVTLGLDPAAKRGRQDAVRGDVRILLVPLKGGPAAIAYIPVVPGTPPDKRRTFAFTGRTDLDRVAVLADAKVSFARTKDGWTVEASIPWSDLGLEPPDADHRLLADVGVLKSDQNGVATVMRVYWAGKSQTVVSDVGFEARLTPALWGDLNVVPEETPEVGDDMKIK